MIATPNHHNAEVIQSVVELYQSRLSTDNAVRKEAENRLTQMQVERPNDLILAVITLLEKVHPSSHSVPFFLLV